MFGQTKHGNLESDDEECLKVLVIVKNNTVMCQHSKVQKYKKKHCRLNLFFNLRALTLKALVALLILNFSFPPVFHIQHVVHCD